MHLVLGFRSPDLSRLAVDHPITRDHPIVDITKAPLPESHRLFNPAQPVALARCRYTVMGQFDPLRERCSPSLRLDGGEIRYCLSLYESAL